MNNKGKILIISGFSGVGKGTVVDALLEKYDNYKVSVSWTTRQPRGNDAEGVTYFFKTREEFEALIEEDGFLEHAQYGKNYYGTNRAYVENYLDQNCNVILEIEVQGARIIKQKRPDALMIYLLPPDGPEWERRLRERATETEDQIADRLNAAVSEVLVIPEYDYVIVNRTIEQCVEDVNKLVQNEKIDPSLNDENRVSNNLEFIKYIQSEVDRVVSAENRRVKGE